MNKKGKKAQPKSKEAECPSCGTVQTLELFDGVFYDFNAPPVNDPVHGRRTALRHKRIYICEQCAQEAYSGHWV